MDKNQLLDVCVDALMAKLRGAAQMHAAGPHGVGHAIISTDQCSDLEENDAGITLGDIVDHANTKGFPISMSKWEWSNVIQLANGRVAAKGTKR
jgi:hypothetical protein